MANKTKKKHSDKGGSKILGKFIEKYTRLFHSLDRIQRRRYLTGKQAYYAFRMFNLTTDVMAKIWKLADIDSNNELICDEFVLAMYLCNEAKNGKDIPDKLPESLVPAIFSETENNVLYYCGEQRDMGIPLEYNEWVRKNGSEDIQREKLCTACFCLINAINYSRHWQFKCKQPKPVFPAKSLCRYCEKEGQEPKRADNMTVHLLHVHNIRNTKDVQINVNDVTIMVTTAANDTASSKRNQSPVEQRRTKFIPSSSSQTVDVTPESTVDMKEHEVKLLNEKLREAEAKHQNAIDELRKNLKAESDEKLKLVEEKHLAEIDTLKKNLQLESNKKLREVEAKHHNAIDKLRKNLKAESDEKLKQVHEQHEKKFDEAKENYAKKRRRYHREIDLRQKEKDEMRTQQQNAIDKLRKNLKAECDEKLEQVHEQHRAEINEFSNIVFDIIADNNGTSNKIQLFEVIAEMMNDNMEKRFICHKAIADLANDNDLLRMKNLVKALEIKHDDSLYTLFVQLKTTINGIKLGNKVQDDKTYYGYCYLTLGLSEDATNSEIERAEELSEECHRSAIEPKRRKESTIQLFTAAEKQKAATKILNARRKKKNF